MDQFWLTEAQFAKIAPHLPGDTRGKERVDDHRVISGIIHGLKSGGCWGGYNARSTGRERRSTMASCAGRPRGPGLTCSGACTSWRTTGPVLTDSSAVKAHRCASGGKGEAKPSHRPLAG